MGLVPASHLPPWCLFDVDVCRHPAKQMGLTLPKRQSAAVSHGFPVELPGLAGLCRRMPRRWPMRRCRTEVRYV